MLLLHLCRRIYRSLKEITGGTELAQKIALGKATVARSGILSMHYIHPLSMLHSFKRKCPKYGECAFANGAKNSNFLLAIEGQKKAQQIPEKGN